MTFDEFVAKYNGKGIDYDGAFGNQCMDLYRQYVKEVLGVPQSPPVPGAKDVWTTYLPEYYDRIENTPTGIPLKGDIVIWGTKMGEFGHIAVFFDGNSQKFNSFDQNYPLKSLCHIQSHSYAGVLGWLHCKSNPPIDQQKLIDELRADRDKNWNLYQQTNQKVIDLEDVVAAKQKSLDAITTENQKLVKTVEDATKEKTDALEALQAATNDATEAKRQRDDIQLAYDVLKAQRKDLAKYSSPELRVELKGRKDVGIITKWFL